MNKIYYTPIQVKTICKNGSERFGANAFCRFSTRPDGKFHELSMFGDSKLDAELKLKEVLSCDGFFEIQENVKEVEK